MHLLYSLFVVAIFCQGRAIVEHSKRILDDQYMFESLDIVLLSAGAGSTCKLAMNEVPSVACLVLGALWCFLMLFA